MLSFQVSTRHTGVLRVVKVRVYPDRKAFYAEYVRLMGKPLEELTKDHPGQDIDGLCISRNGWVDRDPRAHQATILLFEPTVTAAIIAHEVTHAAMHLYFVDRVRNSARAAAHMSIANEPVAYMVGDMFKTITNRLISEGIALHV